MMEAHNIIISYKAVFKTFIILVAAWVGYLVREVLVLLLISYIFALAVEPAVNFLHSKRVPRSIAVIVSMAFSLLIITSLIALTVVPFVWDIQNLVVKIPAYVGELVKLPVFNGYSTQIMSSFSSQISYLSSNIVQFTVNTFSLFVSFVAIVAFTVYLLFDFQSIRVSIIKLFHKEERKAAQKTMNEIERKLGAWFRGELILMTIIGFMTFVGLSILKVDYALALAVIAGLLEVVPTMGPIISAVPAAIVGFAISPTIGFATIGLAILIQQLENQVIVPKVMEKAVGQSPIVTIVVLLIGAKLFGVIGALLAVPVTIIVIEIYNYYRFR